VSGGVAIRVSGARKSYPKTLGQGRTTVVEDVDISVAEGTIHGLLGPNGAGKTTTIKMLLGLVKPDAGDFEVLGVPSRRPSGRRSLGFLPEQPYFPPQLKAAQAMRLYGRLAGVERGRLADAITAKLSMVGLERHADVQLSKYSRGMLQRLGIAQALLGDPRVAVLDEPASGLDPVGQRDMRNLMLSLRDDGVTVLLSSHQLSEVEAVCDQVTIVNRGRVAAKGSLDELLNVEGEVSMVVRDLPDGLPSPVEKLVTDVAAKGGSWIFSISRHDARPAIDAVDEAGGTLVSLNPKRQSLEDYFSQLLEADGRAEEEVRT
jgi:ABC-2 type transport system ATP-binding protein